MEFHSLVRTWLFHSRFLSRKRLCIIIRGITPYEIMRPVAGSLVHFIIVRVTSTRSVRLGGPGGVSLALAIVYASR